ncbi:bile acid:sodium symporter family protein [Gracilibacillus thailandensis]|uniref:Bile acid:sodium symporter family protein n=1 Tax=Gracilibacillus thailandensis TaxID=563735 RepID=A0A6N7R4W2_9BACI|nr:bile acid:sodium symporter family protein [Gracilibacillus thailandensis]MRI68234.1 bile acid:sodium symporter family protein [Gracilibacillus thailandensis]
MLNHLNQILQRIMPFIAPASVIIGVLFADFFIQFDHWVIWIFAFMTFAGSLSLNFVALYRVVAHPLSILIALVILHILMPLWAFLIGTLTFSNDHLTVIGFVLAMIIPTGITSFIWVSMNKGNVALTLSIILIDTILSPFIVPLSLSLFIGASVDLEVWAMMKGLFIMIVIPSILGMILHETTRGGIHEKWSPRLAPFSKIALALVIMINSSEVADYLLDVDFHLIKVAITMFFVAASGYYLAWLLSKWLKRTSQDVISLTFSSGMRNISAGAVIAVQYFPGSVAVPVVVGMLFQQVLASLYSKFLQRRK